MAVATLARRDASNNREVARELAVSVKTIESLFGDPLTGGDDLLQLGQRLDKSTGVPVGEG